MATRKDLLIRVLHREASDYISKRLDGYGYSRLLDKIRSDNTPKAIAIIAWTDSIWQDYYERKAVITDESQNVNVYFNNHGELPYSFYEAFAETSV